MLPFIAALLIPNLPLLTQDAPPTADEVEDTVTAQADELRDLAEETQAEEEEAGWEGTWTLSASKTYGNTDIQTFALTMDAVLDQEPDRYTINIANNYSDENGNVIQRRNSGLFKYDHFLSDKSYLLATVSAEADFQAQVDLRWTAGVGYGYQFRDDDVWKIAGEAGLSYFNEEFTNGEENDYVAARLAYNWEYTHSDKLGFAQVGQIFPSLEDAEDVYAKVDTRARASLTEAMFAQLQWIFIWDNTPATGDDGNKLQRDDHILLLSLGWSF